MTVDLIPFYQLSEFSLGLHFYRNLQCAQSIVRKQVGYMSVV